MVKNDPKMQNLDPEEEEEYITALAEWRDIKVHGVRANNAAVAQDVFATTHRISREVRHRALQSHVVFSQCS